MKSEAEVRKMYNDMMYVHTTLCEWYDKNVGENNTPLLAAYICSLPINMALTRTIQIDSIMDFCKAMLPVLSWTLDIEKTLTIEEQERAEKTNFITPAKWAEASREWTDKFVADMAAFQQRFEEKKFVLDSNEIERVFRHTLEKAKNERSKRK